MNCVIRYKISASRPQDWDDTCQSGCWLFGSALWSSVLEAGFGSETVYAWDGTGGAPITIFSAGPFRVAYLGFPAGETVGSDVSRADIFASLAAADIPNKPTCVRSVVSAFSEPEALPGLSVANPETVIQDLQEWSLGKVAQKARRIRKAVREGLVIDYPQDPGSGIDLYEVYAAVVKGHGGSARYNEAYFRSIVEAATQSDLLDVRVARRGTDLAGFLVTARHGDTAYYLHGGTVPEFRKLSPSDMLMADAIEQARINGCTRFNFMASPPDQDSLVRYKEKWGGNTRLQQTYTAGLRATFPLFRLAESVFQRIR